jgi:hypothetical protein
MTTMTRIAPELPVNDVAEALQHYVSKLGFEVIMTIPAGNYAIVERDGIAVHLFQNENGTHSPGSIHIFATDLDDLFAELQTREANVTAGISQSSIARQLVAPTPRRSVLGPRTDAGALA